MPYDWRADLGDVPDPDDAARKPGQKRDIHPLFLVLESDGRPRAVAVLTKALAEAEGRVDTLSELLGCSYQAAYRLVQKAELTALARTLRVAHGYKGPTGSGVGANPRGKAGAKSKKRRQ